MSNAALRLAKELNVPLDWLVDDTRDWPPPAHDTKQSAVQNISHGELIRELARRCRLDVIDWVRVLDRAEGR